jgi:OFA family oxalate/formate antiporter-like MFS transporter
LIYFSAVHSAKDIRLNQKVLKPDEKIESKKSPRQFIGIHDVNFNSIENDVVAQDSTNSANIYGPLAIAGGAIAHLCMGSFYCWGNFLSYAPNYIKFYDGVGAKGASPDALIMLPATLVAMCFTMPLGPKLSLKFGAGRTMLLGSWIMSLGVFLASYAQSLSQFIAAYALMFGFGVGIGYTAPMGAAWKWLPAQKGMVSGVILTGFGAGGFVFNMIGTKLFNPKGLNPVDGSFPEEVYSGFPLVLRKLAIIYAVVTFLAHLLVTEPKKVAAAPADKNGKEVIVVDVPGLGVLEALKTPQYWIVWLMVVTCASAGLNVASVYKQFAAGSETLTGDGYQAMVGGIGALFNGVGRLFWGLLSDKIGFKTSFIILSVVQSALHFVYPYSTYSKSTFLVATSMCFFLLAGNFALMPPAMQRIFGPKNGAAIYGVLYTAFGVSSVGGMFLSKALTASMGWNGVFKVLSGLSALSAIIALQLQPLANLPGSTV